MAKQNKGGMKDKWPVIEFGNQILLGILVFVFIVGLGSSFMNESVKPKEISISELATEIQDGKVKQILVEGDTLRVTLADESKKVAKKEVETSLSETLVNYGVKPETLAKVKIDIKEPTGFAYWLQILLPFLIPLILILLFFWFVSRQVRGSSMQAFSFGQSKARIIDPADTKQKVTFKDVAGAKEAKIELSEIVDFLKTPQKFLDIGARIPKGVILMGPPGSGKTLLARAVAGEAGVPFLYLSGSEFVEMFVGVGASRVRDLFKVAKKVAPSIVFIDEIDAVGRHRGGGVGGGNDEREQTLNQILVEMDGFEPNEKVIVMAATNRPDVLDIALLRPGRFDRRVTIDLPDVNDREAILKIHAAKVPFAEDVVLRVIAERTPGYSGADLANIMNEASILTARENRKKVSQFDLIRSVEKVMLGPERKSHLLSEQEKKITAYHEMGHALVASVLPEADPVHKVSIISRGRAAGYTLKLPLEEKKLRTRKHFLDDIAVSLGGYAAEKMVFGDLTTGPSNDIAVASALAREMVSSFGMSDEIGPVNYGRDGAPIMVGGMPTYGAAYSETFATKLDIEVAKIMQEGERRAREVIENHRAALDMMSAELQKIETLERKEFENLLILNGIKPKKLPEGEVVGQVITD